MGSWGTTWPVGLLVVVVVLAIIDAIQRAFSSNNSIRALHSHRRGGVTRSMPIIATEDPQGDGD